MPHKYVFKTTPAFRTALRKLTLRQKASARTAFGIFKDNPFGARLRTHKIHGLSAKLRRTIYSASIESDLRAIFYRMSARQELTGGKDETGNRGQPMWLLVLISATTQFIAIDHA
jgi:hypothetical protein